MTSPTMNLRIKKLHPDAIVPTYATDGAACFDLHALTVRDHFTLGSGVDHGRPVECGTGLSFEIPAGYVMLIFSRSGHGFKHAVRLANCVGVIDSDYRGEVKVKLTKDFLWSDDDSPAPHCRPGERIAQAMVLPVERVRFDVVEELSETKRGAGGFGSTGS